MGAEESVPIPAPPTGLDYLVVGLSKWKFHKIIALFGTDRDHSQIREAICQHWKQGLDSEAVKLDQDHSFKLSGFPFTKGIAATPQLSAAGRKMLCQMLQNLNNAGWELKISSDLSRQSDLSTFFFHRSPKVPKPIQYPLLCIGLTSTDKLLLVNTPDNILPVIRDIVKDTWKKEIQEENSIENAYEIKMFGNPWKPYGEETITARVLLTRIFSALAQHHWHFYAKGNMQTWADTLFFKYDPELTPQLAQHFVISFNEADKLRLVNAPEAIQPVVQKAITSSWPKGIQKQHSHFVSWEYKMSGYPWWGKGKDYVTSRYVVCKVLEALQGQGYGVIASIGASSSRSTRDKNIMMLTTVPKSDPSPIMCMAFCDKEKIRLINAPDEIVSACLDVLMTRWYKGIQMEEKMKATCSAYEFKLNGNPWHGGGVLSMHIRCTLCYILQAFEAKGWKVLTSADVCSDYDDDDSGDEYPYDVHSWWFTKSLDG